VQDARSNQRHLAEVCDGMVSTDLLQAAQAGSHSAFETLHKAYSRRLFKQIISITKHHEDAEDALQDALCKAYLALPLFERRCHIYSWLSRIAINSALMKVRQRRGSREMSLDGQGDEDGHVRAFEIPDPGWSPEDLYGAEESIRRIGNTISTLDPASQKMILLRVNHGFSMEEIAKELNVSESAVKARLYRARHVVRDLYPASRCNGR
jgi:RNA polymerase sigma-70 factor (ECF subfamily)